MKYILILILFLGFISCNNSPEKIDKELDTCKLDTDCKSDEKCLPNEETKKLSCQLVINEISDWQKTKNNASVKIELNSEYENAHRLSISNLGWEDGINISRDGLHIYATYIPADFLSAVRNSASPDLLENYDRGPHFDMDLITNPIGVNYPWYHSDIIYASRSSINEDFSEWKTSNLKRSFQSEGAVNFVYDSLGNPEAAVFTSNEYINGIDEKNNLYFVVTDNNNPSGIGSLVTPVDTSGTDNINTSFTEDNPHVERLSEEILVLFFDSEDRDGGLGDHDIWYSTSMDNGKTWAKPINVSTVNDEHKQHQPHLYFDGSKWWLYYAAYYQDKLSIFRRAQKTESWNDWGTEELVVSAGNTVGIGEPTLTSNGDLYFVVLYEKIDNATNTDRYDADPWVVKRK